METTINNNVNNNSRELNSKKIKFEPQRPTMEIEAVKIANVINANLASKIPYFLGTRVQLVNNSITINVAFRPSDEIVYRNPLSNIMDVDSDEMFTLTKKAIELLSPYVSKDQKIPLQVENTSNRKNKYVNPNQQKQPRIAITLDPIKTLYSILEEPKEGWQYVIDAVINKNDKNKNDKNSLKFGKIIVAMEKIPKKKVNR